MIRMLIAAVLAVATIPIATTGANAQVVIGPVSPVEELFAGRGHQYWPGYFTKSHNDPANTACQVFVQNSPAFLTVSKKGGKFGLSLTLNQYIYMYAVNIHNGWPTEWLAFDRLDISAAHGTSQGTLKLHEPKAYGNGSNPYTNVSAPVEVGYDDLQFYDKSKSGFQFRTRVLAGSCAVPLVVSVAGTMPNFSDVEASFPPLPERSDWQPPSGSGDILAQPEVVNGKLVLPSHLRTARRLGLSK